MRWRRALSGPCRFLTKLFVVLLVSGILHPLSAPTRARENDVPTAFCAPYVRPRCTCHIVKPAIFLYAQTSIGSRSALSLLILPTRLVMLLDMFRLTRQKGVTQNDIAEARLFDQLPVTYSPKWQRENLPDSTTPTTPAPSSAPSSAAPS